MIAIKNKVVESNEKTGSLVKLDVAGRYAQRGANNKTASIDATQLNEGVYYYTVKEEGKKVKTEKLVIVK